MNNFKIDMDIKEVYKNYCEQKGITFQLNDKVNPYDDTTLFCPAGMQQFKGLFKNKTYLGTTANIQSCIRMNDFEEIGGYCTEFFIDDVEIGNIVNPIGNCIDVGFGLERLEMFVNDKIITKEQTLKETILKIISSGYKPSNLKQGYVLRKLLRELWKMGSSIEHEYFTDEIERQKQILTKYERLKGKHSDKPKEWWFDTHGINLDEINHVNKL